LTTRLWRVVVVALRLGIMAGALAFLVRGMAWSQIGSTLRGARLSLLAATVGLNGFLMLAKSMRLRLLLNRRASLQICFLANLTSSAINNITPLRGGDLARLWMLERHAQVTKSIAVIVALSERLFDILTLAALATVATWVAPAQRWAAVASPLLLAGAIVAFALARLAGAQRRSTPLTQGASAVASRFARLWVRLKPGISLLRSPGVTGASLGLSTVTWALEAGMVVLTARSLGLEIGFPLAIVLLLGINLALVLPSVPAGAGVFEAGATLVLLMAGFGKEDAVAFAVLYHAVQVIPVTLVGAAIVIRTGPTLGELSPSEEAGANVVSISL
jgi:uncharacterized protein (TIRG00374 family)